MATGSILLNVPPGGMHATTPPGLLYENDQWNMLFAGDTANEICYWSFRMPENYASAPFIKVRYRMDTATSGNVQLNGAIKATADTEDPASSGFDSDNLSGAVAVPGTAEQEDEVSITMTTIDTVAANESVTLRLTRDQAHANDTATGDMKVSSLTLEYTTT